MKWNRDQITREASQLAEFSEMVNKAWLSGNAKEYEKARRRVQNTLDQISRQIKDDLYREITS